MRKIAITGTIGSGKSTACSLLRELQIEVFDCDLASLECSKSSGEAYPKIVERFGKDILVGQEIDRKKLARIIFEDAKAKHDLEKILHPCIYAKMNQAICCSKDFFFAEVPTLFESGWEIYFDDVLLISISDEKRMERLQSSRAMNEIEIQKRMNNQLSEEVKRSKSTWVLENNGTIQELQEKLEVWLQSIKEKRN